LHSAAIEEMTKWDRGKLQQVHKMLQMHRRNSVKKRETSMTLQTMVER